MSARESLIADIRQWLDDHDPRPFLRCETCLDFGMIEARNQEDTCPSCEGGIWRERWPWHTWIERRARLPFGFRIAFWNRRAPWLPTIYRSWKP